MHTLQLTDEELRILHYSLETWIGSFSHDQPELLQAGKALRAKLDAAGATPASTTSDVGRQDTWMSNN